LSQVYNERLIRSLATSLFSYFAEVFAARRLAPLSTVATTLAVRAPQTTEGGPVAVRAFDEAAPKQP
jgi:hypothetical protein